MLSSLIIDYIQNNKLYIRPNCSAITEYESGSLKTLLSESFLQSTLAIPGETLKSKDRIFYHTSGIVVTPSCCFEGEFGDVLVLVSSGDEDVSLTYLFLCARAYTEAGNHLRISVLVNPVKDTIRHCIFSRLDRALPAFDLTIEDERSNEVQEHRRRGRPRTRPQRDSIRRPRGRPRNSSSENRT